MDDYEIQSSSTRDVERSRSVRAHEYPVQMSQFESSLRAVKLGLRIIKCTQLNISSTADDVPWQGRRHAGIGNKLGILLTVFNECDNHPVRDASVTEGFRARKLYARIKIEEEREQIETSLDEALFPVFPGYPLERHLAYVEQVVFVAYSVRHR
jgi:hypothetical protein